MSTTSDDLLRSMPITATSTQTMSSREVREQMANASVSLTKKVPTQTAIEATTKLGERLKSKVQDRMSSTAKSVSSVGRVADLSLNGLTQKIGLAAAAEQLKKNAAGLSKKSLESMVKAKTAEGANILTSALSGLAATKQLAGGEASINAKLANTIATTGPLDELVTKDIYGGIDPTSIITSFKGKVSEVAKNIGDSFKSGSGLAANIAGMLRKDGGGLSLDMGVMKDRLINAVGGRQGLTANLTATLQGALNGNGDPFQAAIANKVNVIVDSVERVIDIKDVKSARGLFDLVGRVVGDPRLVEFVDMGAKTQIMSSIYREAIALGVPEAIDIIIQRTGEKDQSAIYGLTYSIGDAVNRGDIRTTSTMIDRLGRDAVLAAEPQAVATILRNYQFQPGVKEEDYPRLWTELNALLTRLNPQWAYRKRGSEMVIDLNVFTYASREARLLLEQAPEYKVSLMMAPAYPYIHLITRAKQMFPAAAF